MFRRFRLVDGAALVVREAQPDDATSYRAHRRFVLGETDLLLQAPDDPDTLESQERISLSRSHQSSSHLILLAILEGPAVPPAGTAINGAPIAGHLTIFASQYRRVAHVAQIGMAVQRQFWGRGIGAALLETAIQWAAGTPTLRKLGLQSYASNTRALKLYEHYGFREEGRLVAEVRRDDGSYEDLIVMALDVG